MNNNPIGIFDSGIGGLSILREIQKNLPNESLIYLRDEKNFPYGKKSPKDIRKIAFNNTKLLLSKKSKIIIVACNTATVHAISFLRNKLPQIKFVGMEPAIKPACKIAQKGVVVLSSPQAAKSKQVSYLLNKFAGNLKVINIGSLELVQAVEKKYSNREILKICKKILLKKILSKVDILVLGCTHFPLIKRQIQKYVGKEKKVIDSGYAVAGRVKEILKNNNMLSQNNNPFCNFLTTKTNG